MAMQLIDARVLANYGIMQPVDFGKDEHEIRLGDNYGICSDSASITAQAGVIATMLPLDELGVRIQLHGVACLKSGIKLPAGDAASVDFRSTYIRMMAGSQCELCPMSDQAPEQSDGELTPGEFMMLHIAMMERRNSPRA